MKTIMRQLTDAEWRDMTNAYGSGPHFSGPDMAEEAFGDAVSQSGLLLLPYLYRRFGPPFTGCDSVKELASFWLTTRRKGLGLWVSCRGRSLRYCFGVGYSDALRKRFPKDMRMDAPPKTVRDCRAALVEAMRELLRPVCVRDAAFNILGRCESDDNEAPRSHYAGYGCPREALDAWVAEDE